MGYFELKLAEDNQYHFNLKAPNHEILSSELYTAKHSAEKGIASVQAHCSDPER